MERPKNHSPLPFFSISFYNGVSGEQFESHHTTWSRASISLSALGTWVLLVVGALVAILVGIKRKSLAPLEFFGSTGTMLDIIMGINACEREYAERQMKLLEAQNAAASDAAHEF